MRSQLPTSETANAFASVIQHVREVFDTHEELAIAEPEGLEEWRSIFRTMSAAETWTIHGDWIEAEKPKFAAPIAERFAFAKSVPAPLAQAARQAREAVRARVDRISGPTAHCACRPRQARRPVCMQMPRAWRRFVSARSGSPPSPVLPAFLK